MVQPLPAGYLFDPADPRAPSMEQWAQMSPAERDRVVDMLPSECSASEFDFLPPPEGDPHWNASAPLEDAGEMIGRLGAMVDESIARQEDAERLAAELGAKLEEVERQLAEARAEIERLKGR